MWLRKGGRGTDYITHSEICVMMNVIIDSKNRVSAEPMVTWPGRTRSAYADQSFNQSWNLLCIALYRLIKEQTKICWFCCVYITIKVA